MHEIPFEGAWCILPLCDSIPQSIIGPRFLRLIMVLAVLFLSYEVVACNADVRHCHEEFVPEWIDGAIYLI